MAMTTEYIHTAIGVIGVVVDNLNRVLLVLSKDRGWEPPGGFMEPNEAVITALEREVLEESGYEINVLRLTGIYNCMRDIPILSLCFLCSPNKAITNDVQESLDIQWVNASEISKFITYEPHLLRVKDTLNSYPSQLILSHYITTPYQLKSTWIL